MGSAVTLFCACILSISGSEAFSLVNTGKFPSTMLLQTHPHVMSCARMGRKVFLCMATGSSADEERELTNEECEVLNLPYGTKLIGEMSDR